MLYQEAALAVILHLKQWIATNDPGRTTELSWPEVTSNLDHLADDEKFKPAMVMILTDYFADRPEWAVATAHCETGGTWDPEAYNPAGPYVGLMQVYKGAYTVRWNTEQARSIFDRQGWYAWPNCGRNRFR
jgi:hypothetical protein